MRAPLRLAALLALGASQGGCAPDPAFTCAAAADCTAAVEGRCEPDGYCSFEDPGCATGWRYGERAGAGLGGACVADGGGEDLARNGGFEAGVVGWVASDGTIEPSAIARSGEGAARLCPAGSDLFSLLDDPDTISGPAIGAAYRATAWVRTEPAGPGTLASIALREPPPDADVLTASTTVLTEDEWRPITVDHTIVGTAGDALAILVRGHEGTSGACFLIDDVSLVLLDE